MKNLQRSILPKLEKSKSLSDYRTPLENEYPIDRVSTHNVEMEMLQSVQKLPKFLEISNIFADRKRERKYISTLKGIKETTWKSERI